MNDPNNVSSPEINLRPFSLPQVLLPGTREKREEEIERQFAICIRSHAIGFELFAMVFCQS